MDPRKRKLSGRLHCDISSKKNDNTVVVYTERNEPYHEAVYFTGIASAYSSVEEHKGIESRIIEKPEILSEKKKSRVVNSDAFDIEPLRKPMNSDVNDKSERKFRKNCRAHEYKKRWTKITFPSVKRIPSSDIPFKLDPRKIRQIYRECFDELKAKIPKYYGTSKSVINTYHELKKCAFYKRRVSYNCADSQNVKRARCMPTALSVIHNTKTMPDNNIVLEHEENVVPKQIDTELDSSPRNIESSMVSNVPIATVEVSNQLKNTQCLSGERDDLPELLAEAVGSGANVPCQARQSLIKLQKSVQNVESKEKRILKSSTASNSIGIEGSGDEYGVVSSSINAAIKNLKIPKIKPIGVSVVSSTNNSSLTRENEIISENSLSSPSHDQNSTEEKMPTQPRLPTRICSSKSPRISRVVSTDTLTEGNTAMKTASDLSSADENVSTKSLSEKWARLRANLKVDNSRKWRRTSGMTSRDKCKRRKCERSLDLPSPCDTDQESHITASTLDHEESNNDSTNMIESSIARDESDESSCLNISSRTNVEEEDLKIPVISSSTPENESEKGMMQKPPIKLTLRRMLDRNPQSNEESEQAASMESKPVKEKDSTNRISIDSGISVQDASSSQSPRSIEAVELSIKDANDQKVCIAPVLTEHSCVNPSQPSRRKQSLDLDDVLLEQTRLKGMFDRFMCVRPKFTDKGIDISNRKSKNASDSTLLSLPDSSTTETEHYKHLSNPSAITAVPISVDSQLTSDQTILADDHSKLIEKDGCNSNNEESFSPSINSKLRDEEVVKESLEYIDRSSGNILTENPSEITLISKAHSSFSTSLNEKKVQNTDTLMNLQLKESNKQEEKNILNNSSLPPKKRPIINEADNNDNKLANCVESSVSTQLCASEPEEPVSTRDRVIPVTAKKPAAGDDKSKLPTNDKINPLQVLQVLCTSFIPNPPQPLVQLQAPMLIRTHVPPQGLIVNVPTTTHQSHAIVVENGIPLYPVSMKLSYTQEMNKPVAPTTLKNTNNSYITTPSSSTASTSAPLSSATAKSVRSLLTTSTSVITKSATSKPVPLPSVPSSSNGPPIQSLYNNSEFPPNNSKPVDHPVMTTLVSPEITNDRMNYIISSFTILRRLCDVYCQTGETCNLPPTQLTQQSAFIKYQSLVPFVINAINEVGQLLRHSSIYETFCCISAYSTRVLSDKERITVEELNLFYNRSSQTYLQPPNVRNPNLPATNYPCRNQTQRLACLNINSAIAQNVPRQIAPKPVPPLLPSSISNGHPGIAGSTVQMFSNSASCPKPVPPPAYPIPRKSRARPRPRPRSMPLELSAAQNETFKIQISTYHKINRWLEVENNRNHSIALHDESLRQLRQQEIIARQQQQEERQQRERYQKLQKYLLNAPTCRNLRFQNEQQQPQINSHIYEKRVDVQPLSESVKLKCIDQDNTNSNVSADNSTQTSEQHSTIPSAVKEIKELQGKLSAKTGVGSSMTINATARQNESRQRRQHAVSCAGSPINVTTTAAAITKMSTPSIKKENNVANELMSHVNENAAASTTTVQLERDNLICGADFHDASRVDEPYNHSVKFADNEHEINFANNIGNNGNNKKDEQNPSIVEKYNKECPIKSEPQSELQQHQPQPQPYNEDTIDIKEELALEHVIKVGVESYEIKDSPCSTGMLDHSENYNYTYTNEGGETPELITLDDGLTDDEIDCISIISSHKKTVAPPKIREFDEIKYNQSSIDEELECEALSKKLGIQGPCYNQNTSFVKADTPLIIGIMSIGKETYEDLDKGGNHNLLLNEGIIDITDTSLKLERNAPSLQSDDDTTVIDFIRTNIEGSASRPNCSNCHINKATIACECEEIAYCSNHCIRAHWPESHANVCKGPPINITEITLDDD